MTNLETNKYSLSQLLGVVIGTTRGNLDTATRLLAVPPEYSQKALAYFQGIFNGAIQPTVEVIESWIPKLNALYRQKWKQHEGAIQAHLEILRASAALKALDASGDPQTALTPTAIQGGDIHSETPISEPAALVSSHLTALVTGERGIREVNGTPAFSFASLALTLSSGIEQSNRVLPTEEEMRLAAQRIIADLKAHPQLMGPLLQGLQKFLGTETQVLSNSANLFVVQYTDAGMFLPKGIVKIYGSELPPTSPQGTKITKRERHILERVAAAYHNKDIADQLGLSEGTVKVYLSRLFDKLDSAGISLQDGRKVLDRGTAGVWWNSEIKPKIPQQLALDLPVSKSDVPRELTTEEQWRNAAAGVLRRIRTDRCDDIEDVVKGLPKEAEILAAAGHYQEIESGRGSAELTALALMAVCKLYTIDEGPELAEVTGLLQRRPGSHFVVTG